MRAREITKGFCLFFIVTGLFFAMAWVIPNVGWPYLVTGPVLFFGGLGVFLRAHFARDTAPDILRDLFGTYFDRDGFCFTVRAGRRDGHCVFRLFFQTRYEAPSTCRVALRAQAGPWIPQVGFAVECPPGAMGVAEVTVPMPVDLMGREVRYEVGASVRYPKGRGRTLRFKDAIVLRADSQFDDAFTTVAVVGSLLVGSLVFSSPASLRLSLPSEWTPPEQAGTLPPPRLVVLWTPGDPPFDADALGPFLAVDD